MYNEGMASVFENDTDRIESKMENGFPTTNSMSDDENASKIAKTTGMTSLMRSQLVCPL